MSRINQIVRNTDVSAIRRGGRLVKWKGAVASIGPMVSELGLGVSTTALGAALAIGGGVFGATPAVAGDCVETFAGSGIFVCSGAGDAATDTTQPIIGSGVNATTEAGFGIETQAGNAITLVATDGGVFTDSQQSLIIGDDAGIDAVNALSGSLSILSDGTIIGVTDNGITALNDTGTDSLTVQAANVTGALAGIVAENQGNGSLVIRSSTQVSGLGGDGIEAFNDMSGLNLSIQVADVYGAADAINADNDGTGALSIISTGQINSAFGNGITATNFTLGTDLTVEVVDVAGAGYGILASNSGAGDLSITATGMVAGDTAGLYTFASGASAGDTIIDLVDAMGGDSAVLVDNFAAGGHVFVSSTGTLTGTAGYGVFVQSGALAGDVTVNVNNVAGGITGVNVDHNSFGAVSVTATGVVSGTTDYGIGVSNTSNGTDIAINAADASGGEYGIIANNFGTGALSIVATGNVAGANADGVFAMNSAISTDLTIDIANANGAVNGIYGFNEGTGALSITSTGSAAGIAVTGISAYNGVDATDLTIDAAEAYGGLAGISAVNEGTGSTSVTASGEVTGVNAIGINVFAGPATTDTTINTASVTGGDTAIDAIHDGTGSISIASSGPLVGEQADGVYALSGASSTDMNIAVGDVSGGNVGIYAEHGGTGGLQITATGQVTGTTNIGIFGYNSSNGIGVDITAVNVQGDTGGIRGDNDGSGAVHITATGFVSAGTDGIAAVNSINGTDIVVEVFEVGASDEGIFVSNTGSGLVSITATGQIAALGEGIQAFNSLFGTSMDITATDVFGNENGILADSRGSGALNITTTGTVTGTSVAGINAQTGPASTDINITAFNTEGGIDGIVAIHGGSGSLNIVSTGLASGGTEAGIAAVSQGDGITVDAVDSFGGAFGILATNMGTGSVSIASTGNANGTLHDGIYVLNAATGSDVSVDVINATGGSEAIEVQNSGSGGTRIVATGTLVGEGGNGVIALNSAGGSFMTIDVVDITAALSGIVAEQFGSGPLDISATGTITAELGNGIYGSNSVNGTSLTINAGQVIAGESGIVADNEGTAGLTINTTGDITGYATNGIDAYNSANDVTASMVINQAEGTTITGGANGISALNFGGSLTVNALGTVIGETGMGIHGHNAAGATDLNIVSNIAIGGLDGIRANNDGSGALQVISTGSAVGETQYGIYANNDAPGTDLSISAADASGAIIGIAATNYGTGALAINASGAVSGGLDEGIVAFNSPNGTDLTIGAADVQGATNGVRVINNGTGTLDIITTGIVAGATGNAISAETLGSAISITNAGTLQSGNGFAIFATGGATSVTNDGVINGRVQLGDQDDVLANNGTFNADADSMFGGGLDALANAGTINVAGAINLVGLERLENAGLINLADGSIGNALRTDGDYIGSGGTLAIDVSFDGAGSADSVIVAGAVAGTSYLSLNDLSTDADFGNSVLVLDGGAGTSEDALVLADDSGQIGFLAFALSYDAAANDFLLNAAVNTSVFQALKFNEGLQSVWYRSADAWAAQMGATRDGPASPVWLQLYGSVSNRDDAFDYVGSSFTQTITLDYEQDHFGVQAGVEFGPGVSGEGLRYGVTGGYQNSVLSFDGGADRVEYNTVNIGAYAGYRANGFVANALLKYDRADVNVIGNSAGYSVDLDGNAYGMRVDAAYQFGNASLYLQPVASIEYQKSDLSDFSALDADFELDSYNGLRAMAGLKLGRASKLGGTSVLNYYASARLAHRHQSGEGLSFTTGTSAQTLDNRLSETFGRFDAGLDITTHGGVSGFIEANADVGGDYHSFGGRAGLRFAF